MRIQLIYNVSRLVEEGWYYKIGEHSRWQLYSDKFAPESSVSYLDMQAALSAIIESLIGEPYVCTARPSGKYIECEVDI